MSVFQKHKNWWNEVLWKPKKAHSLEQLKFQHHVLLRNNVVTDHNKQLLVETFRSIAEILIWGDQNDSRVFDFFLEKNMQSFFLRILTQKCGRFVCVQLLQTLNILFENIKNETAIYYLLSNNHVNSIIVLKLDFSDEEVMAYYISFLKTLSFKLNKHTIHFFYNEHLRDFPLYTEAIKFFNHSESMVRIAVRTLTLNVYKVNDGPMLEFIRNKTAAPYFSNLIWFIGNHIIDLDECLISQAHHLNRGRLEESVAEHLDHLHYIIDILSLGVESLNEVLIDHLLNRLLIPLYVYSLTDQTHSMDEEESPRISSKIALFLLSQVFLTITHPAVVTPLAYFILTGDTTLTLPKALRADTKGHKRDSSFGSVCAFVPPAASLDVSLKPGSVPGAHGYVPACPVTVHNRIARDEEGGEGSSTESMSHMRQARGGIPSSTGSSSVEGYTDKVIDQQYVLIEASPPTSSSQGSEGLPTATPSKPVPGGQSLKERSPAKVVRKSPKKDKTPPTSPSRHGDIPVVSTVFLDSLMTALTVRSDDSRCLFALTLVYSLVQNKGVHPHLLEAFSLSPLTQTTGQVYNNEIIILILSILDTATVTSNCLRLITLKMAIMVLKLLLGGVSHDSHVTGLDDHHIALVTNIYESSALMLRLYYKGAGDEIFLDMFEDELNNEKSFNVKVPYLMMDASLLLPPTDTPLTGIDFTRRLPCGENERARKAMRVFFAMRMLSQQLSGSEERELPLTMPSNSATIGDIVDLKNCDLVACEVTIGDKSSNHFMVVTETEFLLVDPDKTKLGWGVITFIAFLQDVDISVDPADSCSLYITIHGHTSKQKKPALSGRFQFEDHIRCIAAKQVLQRSRDKLRFAKMTRIAKLLHLPVGDIQPSSLAIPLESSSSYLNDQSPSVISLTPTPEAPGPAHVTMSAAHRAFMPPGHSNETNSQEIEMAALRYSTVFQSTEDGVLDSSIRLAMPSSQGQTVHLDPHTLGARFHRNLSSPRTLSPDCEVETLESSQTEEIQTPPQGEVAVGYKVEKLDDSPQEQRRQQKRRAESTPQETPQDHSTSQPTSLDHSTSQPTPLDHSTSQPTPLDYSSSQPTPLDHSTSQPTPLDHSTSQPTPLDYSTSQPTSLDHSTSQPTPLDYSSSQPTPLDHSTSQPTPLDHSTSQPTPLDYSTSQPTSLDHSTSQPTPLDYSSSQPTPLDHSTSQPTPLDHSTSQPTPLDYSTSQPTSLDHSTSQPTPLDHSTSQPTPHNHSTDKDTSSNLSNVLRADLVESSQFELSLLGHEQPQDLGAAHDMTAQLPEASSGIQIV